MCPYDRNLLLVFLLREDNEADYSVAAEMLKGGYRIGGKLGS